MDSRRKKISELRFQKKYFFIRILSLLNYIPFCFSVFQPFLLFINAQFYSDWRLGRFAFIFILVDIIPKHIILVP